MFSEAEGFIYGVDQENNITKLLDISAKTKRDRESGLHTFDFLEINEKDYLIITYAGLDEYYYLSLLKFIKQ